MISVGTFRREMKNVRRISKVTPDPVFNSLAEAALNFRLISFSILIAQISQSCVSPVAHVDADGILIHVKPSRLSKMETSLPRVAKAIGPFPRITVSLVPNVFLGPQPTL